MATFTVLAKINSAKCSCNTMVAGLGEFFLPLCIMYVHVHVIHCVFVILMGRLKEISQQASLKL